MKAAELPSGGAWLTSVFHQLFAGKSGSGTGIAPPCVAAMADADTNNNTNAEGSRRSMIHYGDAGEIKTVRALTSALRVLQIGAIAVVLVAATFNAFELDRFFVPKELVLHVAAVLAGLLAFGAISRLTLTRVDLLLLCFLLLSALSAALATNRWLALRALTIGASSLVIFWVARALREAGLSRALLGALALAVVIAAVTSLLQTYGLEIPIFSESRVPGGTLGNRNFIAHVAAFGFPLILLAAFTRRLFPSLIGVAIVTGTLALTRSRGAWLAFAVVALIYVVAILFSSSLRRDGRTWRRAPAIIISACLGVAAALLIPNTLRWRSDNPYLESVQRMADYQRGSGRGRLVQYARSLRMSAHHALLGVGPGNWAVDYPAHALPHDPSMSESEPGTTLNPWPSSDWIAFIAERGVPAALLLALVFVFIASDAVRQLVRSADAEAGWLGATLLATVAGAIVAGLFDAVLLLAVPAFLVWATIGALWIPVSVSVRLVRRWMAFAVIVFAIIGAARSAMQLIALDIYATQSNRATLVSAARIDPGNYRLQLRLGRSGSRRDRCAHARAAHALFPSAAAAAEASRGCQ